MDELPTPRIARLPLPPVPPPKGSMPEPVAAVLARDEHGVSLRLYGAAGEYAGDTWHPSLEEALEHLPDGLAWEDLPPDADVLEAVVDEWLRRHPPRAGLAFRLVTLAGQSVGRVSYDFCVALTLLPCGAEVVVETAWTLARPGSGETGDPDRPETLLPLLRLTGGPSRRSRWSRAAV